MPTAPETQEPAVRTWHALHTLHTRVQQALTTALRRYDLTLADHAMLQAAHALHPQPAHCLSLYAATELSTSAASRRITRLQTRGLIECRPSRHDRRCVETRLTDTGRTLAERARTAHDAVLTRLLEPVPAELLTAAGGSTA
ncbi:MarR family transcriptional regulator [Streptomyces monashensis]|uniref:MarR family winged helix-turn-helix transcriptional regulator n=1 Tax=Streptomyces monashensis TaxID=1678012 RepID=UPI0033CDEF91